MKLLNFTTNNKRDGHNLTESQTTYYFDDIQVKISESLTVSIDGYVDLEFDSNDTSFNHSFGTQEEIELYIDTCDVNIHNIWDEDNCQMSLSKELLQELKQEIENELETENIEQC
jgi:hypothetical protein